MRIALAQLNPIVGDLDGNFTKIADTLASSSGASPDLVVFPELFITGYPPRDLLERSSFIRRTGKVVDELVELSEEYPLTGIIVGTPQPSNRSTGRGLFNSALLIHNGEILFSQPKSLLPTYDVFEESRYFDPAPSVDVVRFKEHVLGLSICEDAWNDPDLWPRRYYPFDPQELLAAKGTTLFLNISASPFHVGKEKVRYRIFQNHAKKHGIPFLSVNQVGGNDELVFDGRSMCMDGEGLPIAILPPFREQVTTIDLGRPRPPAAYQPQEEIESVYQALVLGLRDYVRKCGFEKVVIGLSGGIDSTVVCCVAHEALGFGNVVGVTMPGPYSSPGSVEDSRDLAANLGIEFQEIPFSPIYRSYLDALSGHLAATEGINVTRENIQARIRGNLLMALSNEFGYLVLSTGNKSETAIGYCTLYGDMSGGLAVISDVPKTMVYELARYINRRAPIIPEPILQKAPSAELRPGQRDLDTLPPYEILDPILHLYVDEGLSPEEIVERNFDAETVKWVAGNVDKNEYKRRQAAPGIKVTPKAFGPGRRMPIAARY